MNIVSCHGCAKNQQSTVILICCITLVSYYLSKGFVIVETKEGDLYKVPTMVQKKINAVDKYNEYSLLT